MSLTVVTKPLVRFIKDLRFLKFFQAIVDCYILDISSFFFFLLFWSYWRIVHGSL